MRGLDPTSRLHAATARHLAPWLGAVLALSLASCAAAPRNVQAVSAYYNYDFPSAREALRGDAELLNDEQVVLNNLRLGLAAMADGDVNESERALGRVFDLLSTAGLNRDRTTAAVWLHEGVRIWKGEPFEQALAYHAVATHYATRGDWENTRAAAANALFRLTDFGADRDRKLTSEELARREAQRPGYLETGYTAVDTNFALGFLMQGVGADLSGLDAQAPFDAALRINPALAPLVGVLRRREYDTLLIVDYGKGPTKVAYGPDLALARFEPRMRSGNRLHVSLDGRALGSFAAACDVNAMAVDHRWNNLEDVRRAKSMIGDALLVGGTAAIAIGGHNDEKEAQLAGVGAIIAGMLLKAGARADTRHMEFNPVETFLVPLSLGRTGTLDVTVAGHGRTSIVLPDFIPGSPGRPRAVYLRLHGPDSPQPAWLTARTLVHGNDHAGVKPGDWPWILGGQDVSTPTHETLEQYQRHGRLTEVPLLDLQDMYQREGILIGSGMENRPEARKNPSFRHILEGGTGLFTPQPDSMGYKRIMYSAHPPWRGGGRR